jgi:hypothetical protein
MTALKKGASRERRGPHLLARGVFSVDSLIYTVEEVDFAE